MSDFDSCMRKDCNREGELLPGVDCILIHTCARIATKHGVETAKYPLILIHACVRNAIAGAIYAVGHSVILIHACASNAAVLYWLEN